MPGVTTRLRVDPARLDDSARLHDRVPAGHRHDRAEVARGLVVEHIAVVSAVRPLMSAKSARQAVLEHVAPPVELALLLALGERGPHAVGV
jgi:hypothetical protein